MRKHKVIGFSKILLVIAGVIAVLASVFAYPLGLDNNAVIGPKRRLLIALGIVLVFTPLLLSALSALASKWKLAEKWAFFRGNYSQTRLAIWLGRPIRPGGKRSARWWAAAGGLVVFLAVLWLLTAGTLTTWTPYSNYFDRQADGFLSGQLSLPEEPAPELAQLEDVYDWHQREGINYLWDVSYYQGRFYLYWGPLPALVSSAVKLVHAARVEDQTLLLIFFTGMGVSLAAIFSLLRERFFPATPAWTVFAFTLTAALAAPVYYLANRPGVYETAIASAQCFLLLGLYAILRALAGSKRPGGWLLLAGLSLGASLASRFSYAPALLFACFVTGLELLRSPRYKTRRLSALLAFALPLAAITAGLLLFNYARFGGFFETGMRYQLTGDALPEDFRLIYSAGYILPNAYSDLVRPLQTTPGVFPFVSTPYVLDTMWPNFIHRPATFYSGEPVAGIFAMVPFLWALLLLPLWGAARFIRWVNEDSAAASGPSAAGLPRWAALLLGGTLLVQCVFSFSFVMTTMRYLADFTPLLVIYTAVLVWRVYDRLSSPALRRSLLTAAVLLCAASLLLSFFVNMQGGAERFLINNPALYNRIALFFEGFLP